MFPFESSGIAVGEAYKECGGQVHVRCLIGRLMWPLLPNRYLTGPISGYSIPSLGGFVPEELRFTWTQLGGQGFG